MMAWIQENQEANFSAIPFQSRIFRLQQLAESGTGRMLDQSLEEGVADSSGAFG